MTIKKKHMTELLYTIRKCTHVPRIWLNLLQTIVQYDKYEEHNVRQPVSYTYTW